MSRRKNILVVCTLFICTMSWGQGLQRSVEYQTSTVKTYTVPCDAEVELLSAYDSLYLRVGQPLIRQAEHVIENGWLTLTHTYPQQPYYNECYGFQMGKSVTDKWGTKLYDADGAEYYNLENETEDSNYYIDPGKLEMYGVFNELFAGSIQDIIDQFYTENISVSVLRQKLFAVYEDDGGSAAEAIVRVEMDIDLEQFYLEKRTFKDSVLVFTDRAEYLKKGRWIVPKMSKRVYYSTLPSGIPYQITETETYLSYLVKDGDESVIVKTSVEPTIFISFDERKNDVFVNFAQPIYGTVNATIKDMNRNIVLDNEIFMAGSTDEWIIDVDHLNHGEYTIFCSNDGDTVQENFTKEGITDPGIQFFDITVMPNPAKSNIAVTFPFDIDNLTYVAIADMEGNYHYENEVYITGNTLNLYVNFLPKHKLYYILCMTENGIGLAKFFKH